MATPLMPKATAVWLLDNTTLTFKQIADFCELHELEIQAIADGEVAANIVGLDPIKNEQLTKEQIAECEADRKQKLVLQVKEDTPSAAKRTKGARYTPMAKRTNKPDAIAWLIKHHEELSDTQIGKLIGTTKNTIEAIRNKTHKSMVTIKPQNPVTLGLCKEIDLEKMIAIQTAKLAKKAKK